MLTTKTEENSKETVQKTNESISKSFANIRATGGSRQSWIALFQALRNAFSKLFSGKPTPEKITEESNTLEELVNNAPDEQLANRTFQEKTIDQTTSLLKKAADIATNDHTATPESTKTLNTDQIDLSQNVLETAAKSQDNSTTSIDTSETPPAQGQDQQPAANNFAIKPLSYHELLNQAIKISKESQMTPQEKISQELKAEGDANNKYKFLTLTELQNIRNSTEFTNFSEPEQKWLASNIQQRIGEQQNPQYIDNLRTTLKKIPDLRSRIISKDENIEQQKRIISDMTNRQAALYNDATQKQTRLLENGNDQEALSPDIFKEFNALSQPINEAKYKLTILQADRDQLMNQYNSNKAKKAFINKKIDEWKSPEQVQLREQKKIETAQNKAMVEKMAREKAQKEQQKRIEENKQKEEVTKLTFKITQTNRNITYLQGEISKLQQDPNINSPIEIDGSTQMSRLIRLKKQLELSQKRLQTQQNKLKELTSQSVDSAV